MAGEVEVLLLRPVRAAVEEVERRAPFARREDGREERPVEARLDPLELDAVDAGDVDEKDVLDVAALDCASRR